MAPLQRSKSPDNGLQIQHFMHQHVLHKVYMTSEFNCDGCNTSGHGVRYRCSPCDFDIHEQCAAACHRISSLLHPHHHLVLVNRPGDSHVCHVCKGLTNGLSYTCEVQTCEFNVHTLCIQSPSGYNHHQQHQQTQGVQTTAYGGYNNNSNSNSNSNNNSNIQSAVMVNHHPPMQGMQLAGYNGVTTGQPVTVNHQQKQGIGGITNNHQPMMVNHHQPQGVQSTSFGGYQGMNINHQQMIPVRAAGFGGYQGGMICQPVMVNHHQQQLQQQQQQQQLMNIPIGGYSLVNNNQTMMYNHPPPPSTTSTNGYTKVGKIAANILSTSLIGIPIFNSRK